MAAHASRSSCSSGPIVSSVGSVAASWGEVPGELIHVSDGVVIETQGTGERVEHLLGGAMVSTLFQVHVVVGTDARDERELFATEPGDTASADALQPHVLWLDLLAARSQKLCQALRGSHDRIVPEQGGFAQTWSCRS